MLNSRNCLKKGLEMAFELSEFNSFPRFMRYDQGKIWENYFISERLKKQPKAPALWSKSYPTAEFHVIHPKEYLDFIC